MCCTQQLWPLQEPIQDTTASVLLQTRLNTLFMTAGDDKFSNRRKGLLDLKDPANITDSVIYDPKTKQYYIIEKDRRLLLPQTYLLTFDEFMQLQSRKRWSRIILKKRRISSVA